MNGTFGCLAMLLYLDLDVSTQGCSTGNNSLAAHL